MPLQGICVQELKFPIHIPIELSVHFDIPIRIIRSCTVGILIGAQWNSYRTLRIPNNNSTHVLLTTLVL